MVRLNRWIQQTWYHCHAGYCVLAFLLLPLSLLFYSVTALRRLAYQQAWLKSFRVAAPLIVVGNISVGGTGKTPLVVYLVALLRKHGFKPGIISRGYGGARHAQPQAVTAQSNPAQVGDEAVLLARRCQCPVVVSPDRVAAAQQLLQDSDCNVVISDDGLQHYRLCRDIEIVVVDGERGLGNGLPLPAGPLRETASRLKQVPLLVSTGQSRLSPLTQRLLPGAAINLKNHQKSKALRDFIGEDIIAVAAIGNPERFFTSLEKAGLTLRRHAFADHYPYNVGDFQAFTDQTILMTEKDAVKCASFACSNMWYVPIESDINPEFDARLIELLNNAEKHKH